MIKPAGYYVLVKVEEIEQKPTEFVEGSALIMAAPKEQKLNRDIAERTKNSHDVGTLIALGPLAFSGYAGCDGKTAEARAAQWGVKVGDRIDFTRHDGKKINHDGFEDYRAITDSMIICKIEDEV